MDFTWSGLGWPSLVLRSDGSEWQLKGDKLSAAGRLDDYAQTLYITTKGTLRHIGRVVLQS